MLNALSKGVSQLRDKATQQILWLCIGVALVVFIGLWSGIGYILAHTTLFQWGWLETAVDILGGLATGILTWFLFPGVVSAVVGLFLDQIADCVEARHYPSLAKVQGPAFSDSLLASVKFLGVFVALNLAMLPLLLLGPLFPLIFYAVNGYLLSREYFELVAHRRLPVEEARRLRRANRWPLLGLGIVVAFLLTVPLVNLVTPIVATAAMIHLFEGWRRGVSNPTMSVNPAAG
ncbi:MAG: EI24 domain-containing protein [Rhodospirillales bacterium]|nr:EI24 domain-containing protein [Rhodospirillales bacterium]